MLKRNTETAQTSDYPDPSFIDRHPTFSNVAAVVGFVGAAALGVGYSSYAMDLQPGVCVASDGEGLSPSVNWLVCLDIYGLEIDGIPD